VSVDLGEFSLAKIREELAEVAQDAEPLPKEDFLSAQEWGSVWEVSRVTASRYLRELRDVGRIVRERRTSTGINGVAYPIPVYKILPREPTEA